MTNRPTVADELHTVPFRQMPVLTEVAWYKSLHSSVQCVCFCSQLNVWHVQHYTTTWPTRSSAIAEGHQDTPDKESHDQILH